MGLIRGLLSLATAFGVAWVTWKAWANSFELAAIAFSVSAIGRSVFLAWIGRNADVSAVFKNKTTSFIRTPLQEFAFLAPIYMIPGAWTQIGIWTFALVPAMWIVLRATVRFVLGDQPS